MTGLACVTSSGQLIWSVSTGAEMYWVVIESSVLDTLSRWRQLEFLKQPEACGILFGEIRGPHLWIKGATTPFETDFRTPISYKRNVAGHQDLLDQMHRSSDGRIHYLGEWHTHPERIPTPSLTDYMEWAKTSNSGKFYDRKLTFLIVGVDENWLGVHERGLLTKAILE